MEEIKICNKCHLEKPLIEYFFLNGKPRSICKNCHILECKLRRLKKDPFCKRRGRKKQIYRSPEEMKEFKWQSYLKCEYGLTIEEYKKLLDKHNNLCAICFQPQIRLGRGGKNKPLCIDHNHKTGKIRGFLCDDCNFAIGALKENIELFLSAIKYLEKYEK